MTQTPSDGLSDKVFRKPDTAARRSRLREFQSQLVERMQAARSGVDARVNQLGIMIDQSRWLLNLQEAGEIVSVGPITPVPLTQEWFLGLSNLRGNLISVIDFARFQGLAPSIVDKNSRIVAFAPALSFNSGLLVSRVMGLRNVAEMEVQSIGPDEEGARWATRRYIDQESQVWTELNLSLVVQDPQFLHVGLLAARL
ncbi:MAG: chemotaxis protein CheW [Pseudomonadota bacterium]